jgi:hypothetical protein
MKKYAGTLVYVDVDVDILTTQLCQVQLKLGLCSPVGQ